MTRMTTLPTRLPKSGREKEGRKSRRSSQLQLLPLSELLELVILVKLPLLIVVLVCLQGNNCVPDLVGFVLQLITVHLIEGQGLDTDGQRDLHLLLHLLLGLG